MLICTGQASSVHPQNTQQFKQLRVKSLTYIALERITLLGGFATHCRLTTLNKSNCYTENPITIEFAAATRADASNCTSPIMRNARSLTKALQAQSSVFIGSETQNAASTINVAARLYSSATSSMHSNQDVTPSTYGRGLHASHFVLPQQQLTSLLVFPHARSFSSGDSVQAASSATDFVDDAAISDSAFDPSAVLSAVAGVEEDGWLAAREDVWFFNRYMQTVLRFAQDATGLPW